MHHQEEIISKFTILEQCYPGESQHSNEMNPAISTSPRCFRATILKVFTWDQEVNSVYEQRRKLKILDSKFASGIFQNI